VDVGARGKMEADTVHAHAEVEGLAERAGDPRGDAGEEITLPRRQGTKGVGGQVRPTAVKGQVSPAAAERRPAAVAILQPHQPGQSKNALETGVIPRAGAADAG